MAAATQANREASRLYQAIRDLKDSGYELSDTLQLKAEVLFKKAEEASQLVSKALEDKLGVRLASKK